MPLFNRIDLSQLPPPDAVQKLDYAVIRDAMLADVNARARLIDPEHTDFVPSDSAYLITEAAAYRELHLRQQLNDQSAQLMLAYATGANLDHIAATYYRVSRLVIQQIDASTVPPTPEIKESDDDLRQRAVLSVEAWSNAGSTGAYAFHALSGSQPITSVELIQHNVGEIHAVYKLTANSEIAKVLSVGISSPRAGEVLIAVLARDTGSNNGMPNQATLDAVALALNSTSVRPLTDTVTVQAADIVEYEIEATLYFYTGADKQVLIDAVQKSIEKHVADNFRVGRDMSISGIYDALHQTGMHGVVLANPVSVTCDDTQAARCTEIKLIDGGISA